MVIDRHNKSGKVHVVPMNSEDDGEGGYKEPKDHGLRIADWLHLGVTKSQKEP